MDKPALAQNKTQWTGNKEVNDSGPESDDNEAEGQMWSRKAGDLADSR